MKLPEAASGRHWLADVLSGRSPDSLPDFAALAAIQLIAEARQQGVVALVNQRLLSFCRSGDPAANEFKQPSSRGRDSHAERNAGAAPTGVVSSFGVTDATMKVSKAFAAATREAVLWSMLLEAETRHLLAVMAQAAIPGLLLKGQAIAQWAYPDPSLRAGGDIDVLVATRDASDTLARALCESGYELFQPSGDLVALEMMLRREVATGVWVEIDLHCRVINSPLFSERFTFDELMADAIALPRLGSNARGLGPAHAFIHACMHWAATLAVGADIRLKWLYDIPAFASVFSATDWQRLEQLAVARGLAGVCLSMIEAAQATFGADFVAVPGDLTAALREAARHESLDVTRLRDWRYMQFQAFLAQPTARLRARYLWQRLWPSRDYMAYLYQRPDLGYLGLIGIRVRTALRRLLG